MGLTYSTPQTDRATVNKMENVSKLAELNLNESEDLLDSLNITELNRVNIKEPLPILGGNNSNYEEEEEENLHRNFKGGKYSNYEEEEEENLNRNTKFISSKNRFNKYDLFKVINELENKNKINKNLRGGNIEEEELSKSISNEDAMEQVQKIILQELEKVSNKNMTGGGDCGCNGSKNNLEGGRKKTVKKNQPEAKTKKTKKTLKGGVSSSEKIKLATSQSGSESSYNSSSISSSISSSEEELSSNGNNEENEKSEENGLSIFPMNSSDVNNSSSERKFRMLRRRV
jgi:hypothetical protein